MTNNKGFKQFDRAAGVLLNISSLPSEYGIGCFSRDADVFADLINDMGFHWWQVLPITAIGECNSPYSGASTYAGNRLYICPAELCKIGLLSEQECAECKYHGEPYSADYDFAFINSERYLRLAFSRIDDGYRADMQKFRNENSYWIEDYALFMALSQTRSSAWWRWEEELKSRNVQALETARKEYAEEIDFFVFEQCEFYRQWKDLKRRINAKGVQIIGDLPFYVSTASADVWAHSNIFQLDKNLFPKAIPGVPPDAFAKDGQVWGANCLYDFDAMKADGFDWWRRRIKHCFEIYDALRLDHFRAFYNYFSIPACDYNTAKNGHWESGPANGLLEHIKADNPDALFIAEDLGLIDADCREYIDSTGIATMRVFQFGFDGTPSIHIPYRYEVNNVAYTGTHDNNTTLGWLYELNEDARNYVLKYCSCPYAGWGAGGPYCQSTRAIIKTVIASSATLAVIPFQDLLGYGADTRINIPGVAEGNWKYRLPYHLMTTVDRDFYLDLNRTYSRLGHGAKK